MGPAITKEFNFFTSLEGEIRQERLPEGELHPVKRTITATKNVRLDDSNFRLRHQIVERSDAGLPKFTEAELAALLRTMNPSLLGKFQDSAAPLTPPLCIPKLVNGEVVLVALDGNSSVATLGKMAEDGDVRAETVIIDVLEPPLTTLQEAEISASRHCGEFVHPWDKYNQAAKMEELISLGKSEAAAAKQVGMDCTQYKKWKAAHTLHVEFERTTSKRDAHLHTKLGRFVDAGTVIATNPIYKQSYFTALVNGVVGDTNHITGARIREIMVSDTARPIFETLGYEAAMEELGYEFKGQTWKKTAKSDKRRAATTYWAALKEVARCGARLNTKDFQYLKQFEVELARTTAQANITTGTVLQNVALVPAPPKKGKK